MIFNTLQYLKLKLDAFLQSDATGTSINSNEGALVLDNIAKIEDPGFQSNNRVIATLVNLEEESTLKNRIPKKTENGRVKYERPPVNYNLYVLFCANFSDYNESLKALSKVSAFFQSKNYFSYTEDPPPTEDEISLSEEEKQEFKIYFDLYTMTFEQLNHLWGSLGGKQVPSLLYKVRLVPIKYDRLLSSGRVIERVNRESALSQ